MRKSNKNEMPLSRSIVQNTDFKYSLVFSTADSANDKMRNLVMQEGWISRYNNNIKSKQLSTYLEKLENKQVHSMLKQKFTLAF